MAFDKTPTAWIEGWSSDGTTLSLPLASLPALSADDANPSTGDIRKIVLALAEKLVAVYAAAGADRPTSIQMTKRDIVSSLNQPTVRTYYLTFKAAPLAFEIAEE